MNGPAAPEGDRPSTGAPIIVLGAPRSGTTLLAALLGEHSDCVFTREARLLWRAGNDRRSDELRVEHATPQVVAGIRGAFEERVAAAGGGRLVEKTPANAVRPWFVDAVFPEARYVHVTRNGWSAVPAIHGFWSRRGSGMDARQAEKLRRRVREARPSQIPFYAAEAVKRVAARRADARQLYGPRLAGLGQIVAERGRLEASAAQWQRCVEQSAVFGEAVGPDRYRQVRLEDLDAAAVRDLLAFLDLEPSATVTAAFAERFDPSIAARRRPMTDDERLAVAPYVRGANLLLGYPDEP